MVKFNVKQNKSICVLPWIQEFKSVGGHTAPCCVAKPLKNQTMADIRKQMLQDKSPNACEICYKSERHSNWSHRLEQTATWIKKHGEPDVNNPSIQYVDIRFDPTCNLKCKTCNPGSSTLWQKEKGIKFNINQENYNELEKYKDVSSDLVKDILQEAAKINQNLILPLAKAGVKNQEVLEILT